MPITHQYINPFQGMASFAAGYFKTKKEREGQENAAQAQQDRQDSMMMANAAQQFATTAVGAAVFTGAGGAGDFPRPAYMDPEPWQKGNPVVTDRMKSGAGIKQLPPESVLDGYGANPGGALAVNSLIQTTNAAAMQASRADTMDQVSGVEREAPGGFATDDSARRRADSRTVQGFQQYQEDFGQWQRDVAKNDWRKRVGLSMMGLGPMPTYPSGATGTPAAYQMGAEDIAAGRFAEYGEAAGRQGIPSMFDPEGGYGYGGGYGGGRRRSRGRARGGRAGGGTEIPEGLDLVSLGYHTLSGDPYGGQGATGKSLTEGVGKSISEDMLKKLTAEAGFSNTTDFQRYVGLQQHRAKEAGWEADVAGYISNRQELRRLQDVVPALQKQAEKELRMEGRVKVDTARNLARAKSEEATRLAADQMKLRRLTTTGSGLTPEEEARKRGEAGTTRGGVRQQKAPPSLDRQQKAKVGAIEQKMESINGMDHLRPHMKRAALETLKTQKAVIEANPQGKPPLTGGNSLFQPVHPAYEVVSFGGSLYQMQEGKLERIGDAPNVVDISQAESSVITRGGQDYTVTDKGEFKPVINPGEDRYFDFMDRRVENFWKTEESKVGGSEGAEPYVTPPDALTDFIERSANDYFLINKKLRTTPMGFPVAEPPPRAAPAAQDITPWYIDERSAMSFSEFSMRHARGEHGIGDLVKDGPGAYRRWQGGPAASDVGDPRNWKDMPKYRD